MNKYDDIINLEHHISSKRKQMSILSRAAQFAPFAALTGYEDAIKETGRVTNKKIELSEYEKNILDSKINIILDNINTKPEICFTCFIKDKYKDGGKYIDIIGIVRKIDFINNCIILTDKNKILISDIFEINGDILDSFVL